MARGTENFFMRNATSVAITAITLFIIAAGILLYRQSEARNTTKSLLVHTYEVTGHVQLLFNRLKDVELGQRGYILTGEEDYLAPYYDALKDSLGEDAKNTRLEQHHSIAEELAILRKLTQDNPVQLQNLDEMGNYLKNLLDYWAATIETRRAKGNIAGFDFHRGKQLMDDLHRLVAIMMAEENRLLAIRSDADEASMHQSNVLIFSGLILFSTLKGLLVWLYQRSRKHYTQELEQNEEQLKMQQEELQTSNEEMEITNEELEEQNAQIQQQKEELKEKADELERASKYKSEFLANMSHELRTPLNSLLILSKLHAANESGNLTAEQVEEAQVIYNGGLELLGLINDILDLSKVEAGKLTVNAEDVSLDSMVKRLQQQFTPLAKQTGVAFPVRMSEHLPEMLYTDAQRVEQILKNLLANAFKFTETGSVALEGYAPDEKSVAFSVIDTGIGIEPSKFKDIFEAFQQEDGSIDRHYGGTGLGLTIARKFARLLGGEIHVTSEKGKGSKFTLILPLKPVFIQAEEAIVKPVLRPLMREIIAEDNKSVDSKDKVLLIIEDDKNFAGILVKIACKRGYKAITADDGKTGLMLALEHQVTAIILDLTLPDIDGMQVLDQLKANLRTRSIPVHIITGRDAAESMIPLRKGAIGYLTKPVEKEAIDGVFTKIESLLQAEVKRVLIIEDDKSSQVAIQSLLKKQDTELTLTATGNAALEHIRKTHFDCIILDLQLPDMTGFEWLEETEKTIGDMPPVIVYTARELREEENYALGRLTSSIIIKGAKSPERLLDEVTLFLHSVESTLSPNQQEIIRMQHDPHKLLQGRTILLTDDDMRNTFALSKLLKAHGMTVVIAENGRAALDKLKENTNIELALMDIMMPIMDGYQTMREIRAQTAWRNLPIIALTARAMPEEQEKCIEAGANDYLTKPVDSERLLALLRLWLFKRERAA